MTGIGSAAETALAPAHALQLAEQALPRFVQDLQHLVNLDCGSHNAAGVNKVADLVCQRLAELRWTLQRRSLDSPVPVGDLVIGRRPGSAVAGSGPRILLLAHLDTVFEDGTAQARPFSVRDGRAFGPGVCDDKAGLLAGLAAAQVLQSAGRERFGELVLCCTPDEEIGSPASRATLQQLAREADYVLSLECAREDGSLVKARKGVVDMQIAITGRAAHPGIERERGASAALAAAGLVIAAEGLNGTIPGASINVGRVRAGTRANVVAAGARVDLEIRAETAHSLQAADAAVASLAARLDVPGTRAEIHRSGACPPMAADAGAEWLAAQAAEVACELGFVVRAVGSGGVADANYAAATGTPTLDGLGPVGGDDHSESEWVDLASVVPRVAMLAGLIDRLSTRSRPGR